MHEFVGLTLSKLRFDDFEVNVTTLFMLSASLQTHMLSSVTDQKALPCTIWELISESCQRHIRRESTPSLLR
jgi:hypothetical protein